MRESERGVRLAEFKARMSEYLRRVRKGHVLILLNRDTPVARVLPVDQSAGLPVRLPTRRLRDVALPGGRVKGAESLSALLEERQAER